MTLATKNGSLIVKDGKFAENCGCCGDWYCCQSNVSSAADAVQSIQVVIAAENYESFTTANWSCLVAPGTPPPTPHWTWYNGRYGLYYQWYNASPAGQYAGSHTLTRGADGVWKKVFPPDPVGHAAFIQANVAYNSNGSLSISCSLEYMVYGWGSVKRPEWLRLPSEWDTGETLGVPDTRTISDMSAVLRYSGSGSAADCYASGEREVYNSSLAYAAAMPATTPCTRSSPLVGAADERDPLFPSTVSLSSSVLVPRETVFLRGSTGVTMSFTAQLTDCF